MEHRRSALSTIVGLGIVTAIFMAIMSMFYLQQIPTQEDLDRLEDDLRREHGLYLASAAPLDISLVRPDDEGERTGLAVVCTLRPDLRKKPETRLLYMGRLADGILDHPDWQGRVSFVTVTHAAPDSATITRAAKPAPDS